MLSLSYKSIHTSHFHVLHLPADITLLYFLPKHLLVLHGWIGQMGWNKDNRQ